MKAQPMTPWEFYQLCAAHDWTFEFSDDGSIYRRGRDQRRILLNAMKLDNRLATIYNEWAAYINAPSDHPYPFPPQA